MNCKRSVGGGKSYSAPEFKEMPVRIETGFAASGIETEDIYEKDGEWD